MGTGSDPPSTTTTTTPSGSTRTTGTSPPSSTDSGGGSYDSVAEAAAAEVADTEDVKSWQNPSERTPTAAGYSWNDWATPTLPGSRMPIEEMTGPTYDLPGAPAAKDYWGAIEQPPSPGQLQPRYSSAYPLYTLNQMSTPQLAALELKLYQAGYANEPEGATSRWGLLQGFTSLVTEADFGRSTWEDQLEYAVENAVVKEEEVKKSWRQLNPFIAPVEQIPDYASLSQRIKTTVREQLRRDPTSSEMQLLSTYLKGQYKNAYQSNELQTARNGWEAMARGQETGESQSAGSVNLVDPISRFNDKFDERFGGEIDHRRRVEQTASNTKGLFSSLDTMTRMI